MDLTMCGSPADFLEIYRGRLALNVKVGQPYVVNPETLKRLSVFEPSVQNRLLAAAEDAVKEVWWADVRMRAHDLNLGDVYSDGRSGGWLVFKMTFPELERRIEEAESSCKHCERPYALHLEGKCPFDSTEFEPENTVPFQLWKDLRVFSQEVKESLKLVGGSFDEEVQFQIDNYEEDE